MVMAGLLLIALSCLVVGLVLQSPIWLVASLIATTGAGFLLYKLRNVLAVPATTAETTTDSEPATETTTAAEPSAGPEFGLRSEPTTASHRATGSIADPAQTAVLTADPDQGRSSAVPASTGPGDDEVWVIDGRPRYHSGDCAIIKGQQAESIPFAQATEDGFMACSLCEPPSARTR